MLALPPPPRKENMSTPLNPIAKESMNLQIPPMRKPPMVLYQRRRTNPIIWCGAICCLLFSLILIFFGIATLIIYLVINPRTPLFDIANASLSTIYFDSPEYFNGDFAFIANFTNPNRKIDIQFEYLHIELYFFDKLIATQALQAFHQSRGETRLETVHLISSLVYLPQNLAFKLQRQVQSNRIIYDIRGRFRVRANLGMAHFTYWLYGKCQLEITGPPYGVLAYRSCRTTR